MLQKLLDAIANLAAIASRGLDHVDPAGAHREGVTAVLEAAAEHHTDVDQRLTALEGASAAGVSPEVMARIEALEATVSAMSTPAQDAPPPPSGETPTAMQPATALEGPAPGAAAADEVTQPGIAMPASGDPAGTAKTG